MIFNKKGIVFLLAVLYNITALAQSEVLTLYKKDGTIVQYSFIDNPKILQQGEDLLMKTDNIKVSYPFNDISKYTLNESKEEVNLYDIIIDNDNLEEYTNEADIEGCDITYTRTFNDTHWQSFYVPFEVEPRELSDDFEFALINNFHQYDDNDDGLFDRIELEIKRCDPAKTLQANYPYLVRSKSNGRKEIKILSSTLYATEEYSIDCSSVEFKYTFTGSYQSITNLRKKGCYFLDGGYLTKAHSSTKTLDPFRWTMSIEARGSQYKDSPIIVNPQKIKVRLYGEDDTTVIEDVESSTSTTPKEIYTIDGIKRNDTKDKGIYILKMKDGSYKKVFIK